MAYTTAASDADLSSPVANVKEINNYFSLDLRIPKITKNSKPSTYTKNSRQHKDTSKTLPKFGLVKQLKQIFGDDILTENPWLNEAAAVNYFEKIPKRVKFRTTEIENTSAQLPNCRRNFPIPTKGRLHAPSCRNFFQEDVDTLGDHTYQNRLFILQILEEKVKQEQD